MKTESGKMKTENTKFKDSGLPYVGNIPSDWKVLKGKVVLELLSRPVRPNDEIVTCFRDGEVVLRKERREDGFTMSDKEIGYQGINKGDIVIHGMDGFAGAIGVSKSTGKGTPVYVVCQPKHNESSRYLVYYLRTLAMNNVFLALSTGIRERSCDLRWNKISVLPFIIPSDKEQQRIADFLDKKCAEIDELSALQETMIAELKRYKQSVITEAVTGKWRVENGKLKDSGVEWIGDIPEGWGVCRLKDVVHKRNEKAPNSNFKYIGLEHLVSFSKEIVTTENVYDSDGANMCYTNDVIFGKLRPYLGKAKVIDDTCCCSSEFIVLFNAQCPNYLRYLMLSGGFIEIVNASTYGTKMPRANADFIMNMQIPNTPLSEQQAIADYLDEKCGEIDELIAIKQQKIEQLKEYKKSVIFEYVTGKKEVER